MTTRANLKIALLGSLIFLGGTAVWAKDGPREGRRAAFFNEMDADGDGALTQAEIQAHAAARFGAADTDSDGFLSAEELQAAADARRAQRQGSRGARMLERLDANNDGRLEMDEMTGRHGDPAAMFARLDTDEDGALSVEEFAKARGMGRHHHGPGKRGGDGAATE